LWELTSALVGHQPQTAIALKSIGLVRRSNVGNQQTQACDRDLDVQVVVGHVQHIAGLLVADALGAADCAREVVVGRRVGCLPHVVELPQQVRNGVGVEVVVDERYDALLLEQHLAKGGPVCKLHGGLWRLVDVLVQSGGSDRLVEVLGCNERFAVRVLVLVVVVAEDDRDDIEGVCFDPCYDLLQVVLDRAGVEEIARCVAVVESTVDVVGLALQHANAIVQLLSHAVVLVTAYVALLSERRIVSSDLGDVGIFAVAELEVVVARLCVLRQGCRACGRSSRCPGPVATANVDDGLSR
jgi:hypothetical protein